MSNFLIGPKLLGDIRKTISVVGGDSGTEGRIAIPTRFEGGGGTAQLKVGTFSGSWPVGASRVVTLLNSTQTASVVNLCVPSNGNGTNDSHVVFAQTTAGLTVVEIEGEASSECGKKQGPALVRVTFESCFGGGADFEMTSPGANIGPGALGTFKKNSGGNGYAVYGRSPPVLSVLGGGTGATFTISTVAATAATTCDLPYWKISAVTAKGGSGYVDGEQLTVKTLAGTIEQNEAALTLKTTRSAPSLSAVAAGGAGASLSVSTTKNAGTPDTWGVSDISASGGSGYPDSANVTVSLGNGDVCQTPAVAVARATRGAPTVAASIPSTFGFGANITLSLGQSTDDDGRPVWGVTSLSVGSGGVGYAADELVKFVCTDGNTIQGGSGYVSQVNKTGTIQSVGIFRGGKYYKNLGSLDLVTISDGGKYYNETPSSVVVDYGGQYYLEDKSKAGIPSPITATLTQVLPSNGTNGKVTAIVDTAVNSLTFGQVSGLKIDNGGTGYLAWTYQTVMMFGGADFTQLDGFKADEQQILGHTGANCLKWYSVTTCSTALTTVTNTAT